MARKNKDEELRLIDYLVIVGAKRPDGTALQTPSLLNRYPKEERPSFTLPQDIVYFCQPEGCINVCRRSSQSLHEDTTSFVFTLTEKDTGHTRYGVCVNFYRPFERKDLDKLRKKGYKKRTEARTHEELPPVERNEEEFSDDDESKITDARQGLTVKPTVDTLDGSPISRELSDAAISDENSPVPVRASPRRRWQRTIRTHTLTSLCIISRQPFISGFRRCLLTMKRIVEACYHRTKRKNSRNSKQYNSIWAILSGSANLSMTSLSGVISKEVEDIENWVGKLLHAPVPQPGKTKLLLELLPSEMQPPLVFALPDASRLSLLDFPFHLPLELLGIDLCLKVLTAILLEQKIVLRSKDYNALSMSVLAFTSSLYPLQYMFPVIPLLPACLPGSEQLLLAPTPYIIGVPTPFFDGSFALPNDVWLVDLDCNELVKPELCKPLPKLPEPEGSTLKAHLKQVLESMSLNFESNDESDAVSELKGQDTKGSKKSESFVFGNDVDSVDVAARVTLVRFLLSPNVLSDLSKHTKTLRLYPRPVVAFQGDSFIQSRPKPSEFTKGLATTQAVEYFGEWSLSQTSGAFMKIDENIFDPAIIGDKSKWFSDDLEKIHHTAIDESTLFLSTLADADEGDGHDSDNCPTDESGSYDYEAEGTSTSCSSFSYDSDKNDSSQEQPGAKSADIYSKDDAKVVEEIPEPKEGLSQHNGTSESVTHEDHDELLDASSERTPSNDSSTSTASSNSEETVAEILSASTNIKPTSVDEKSQTSQAPARAEIRNPFPSVKGPRRTLIDHRSVVRHGSSASMTSSRKQTVSQPSSSLDTTENRAFVKDIANNATQGKGPGWLNMKKVSRMMECEELRKLLIETINRTSLLDANEDFFEHVEIGYRVYRALSELLKCAVAGIEHSYKLLKGLGGIASALQLLEVAHTHYYCKQIKTADGESKEPDSASVQSLEAASEGSSEVMTSDTKSLTDDSSSIEGDSSNSQKDAPILKDAYAAPGQDQSDAGSVSSDLSATIATERRFRGGKFVQVESTIEHDEERVYLAQALLGNSKISLLSQLEDQALEATFQLSKDRSDIWDDMEFWERMFIDAVALERDDIGMDQKPEELLQRYRSLVPHERRRLEEDEDLLLATMLFNMMACMITMKVSKIEIKKKIRRLLGKSHVGLTHSAEINLLLDQISELSTVCIDLKPCRSRHIKKQSFVVHYGTDPMAGLLFMEVCDKSIILRTGSGVLVQRWWNERIINITFCPKTQVLCLWTRKGSLTKLDQFYTTKCRELYHCIKEALDKSIANNTKRALEGEFPVQDVKSGECGLLQVATDGVNLNFDTNQVFLPLTTIRKCKCVDGVVILEQYKQDTDEVTLHKFKSAMAYEATYAVLCLFSIAAVRANAQSNRR